MKFDVRADVREAKRFYSELGDRGVNSAASNALNVVGRTIRNESVAEVHAVRQVQRKSMVGRAITLQRAIFWRLVATIYVTGRPLSLKEYSAKQGPRGTTVNVEGKPRLIKSAFGPGSRSRIVSRLTFTKGGRRTTLTERSAPAPRVLGGHVYRRKGKARLPIQQLFGPGFPTGFLKDVVQAKLRAVYERDWPVVFREKIEDQLAKLRASIK